MIRCSVLVYPSATDLREAAGHVEVLKDDVLNHLSLHVVRSTSISSTSRLRVKLVKIDTVDHLSANDIITHGGVGINNPPSTIHKPLHLAIERCSRLHGCLHAFAIHSHIDCARLRWYIGAVASIERIANLDTFDIQ